MADRISSEVLDYAAVGGGPVEIELHDGEKFTATVTRTEDTGFVTSTGVSFKESQVRKARHAGIF